MLAYCCAWNYKNNLINYLTSRVLTTWRRNATTIDTVKTMTCMCNKLCKKITALYK